MHFSNISSEVWLPGLGIPAPLATGVATVLHLPGLLQDHQAGEFLQKAVTFLCLQTLQLTSIFLRINMMYLKSPGKLTLSRNSQPCNRSMDREPAMEKILSLDLPANLCSYNYWQMVEAERIRNA